ncbi:hypothetical protein [Streptomyces sp. PSAA01]|uniref:hypothetical protein n=1 Tax=Streptomyces sp. PSAA01 TaxID=2912762 RepID=UPI001F41F25A|nr:hypothetical protein [Streptomyces sp. PSAA01]MCG0284741.1 hypothetical protein [Streptomyces sp. PSAA01]
MVSLLHRATEAEAAVQAAEGAGPEPGASAPPPPGRPPEDRPSRHRLRLTLAAVGAVVIMAGGTAGIIALRSSDDGGSPGGAAGSSPLGDARITVYNAEKDCQHQRVRACSLGLRRIRTWPTARRTSWAGPGTATYCAPTAASPTASR